MSTPTNPRALVLACITRGWHVVPCHSVQNGRCTCGDRRCASPGKHPRTPHGFYDATVDERQIRAWLIAYPTANWAVRTGAVSNLTVIDVDRHDADGFASLAAHCIGRGEPLPTTLVTLTGGDGLHLYFADAGVRSATGWLPGVDVKSDTGYVMLPGSTHISGGTYRSPNWADWIERDLPALPDDVVASIRAATERTPRSATDSPGGAPLGMFDDRWPPSTDDLRREGFRLGERDDGFLRLAWRLVRQHYPHRDVINDVIAEVWSHTDQTGHPYPLHTALAKVDRAWGHLEPGLRANRAWTDRMKEQGHD